MALSFAPKRSSDRSVRNLSDGRLGAKLRVTDDRCVIFDFPTYVEINTYLSGKPLSELET